MFMTGQATNIPFLLLSTVVMSFGFHFFYPTNNAVVLMAVEKQHTPKSLGQLRSLAAVAALAATGAVYLLAESWGYRRLFMVVGVMVAVGGLLLLPLGNAQGGLPPRRRVVLRRRYWLYYTLSFLMGSRRHIFTHTPKSLGQLRSLAAVAALAATGAVYLLAESWGYRRLFMVVGVMVAVGGLLLLPLGNAQGGLPPRRRVVLRRRYWLLS